MTNRTQLRLGLFTGVSALALASLTVSTPVFAQAAAPATEEVVVTGSRLVTNGNDMPTPVTVVSPATLTTTVPATVFDGLQLLPQFAGGRSPAGNPFTSAGNNNAHQLNLRSVGVTRTLNLIDGRRMAPTSQAGEVDVDQIPQMLLQRVDVVTGGVSAVYGSDAVAGVVNFITDKKFNGVKVKAQAGVSVWGDGKEQQFGIAGGMSVFGGKGHIEGSYEWYNNDGVLGYQKNKRPWAQLVWGQGGNGSAANPYHLVQNVRIAATSFLGYITTANPTTNPLRDMVFGQNGVLRPFNHGSSIGVSGNESGGDGAYFDNASLEATAKRNTVFGRFDYDITDNISAYAEGSLAKIQNIDIHQTNEERGFTYSATNGFLAPQYQAQLAAAKITQFILSKFSHSLPTLDSDAWVTDARFDAGIGGTFAGYKWDVSYAHSANKQKVYGNFNLDEAKLSAALDAVVNPANGQVVCSVTLTNPGLYPGCVPLNNFGPTSESAEADAYILTKTYYIALNDMDDIGGEISGSPFDDWAGPVQVALSAEYRAQRLKVDSNVDPTAHPNCTGLRFNCNANTPTTISFVVGAAPAKEQTVPEVAGEVGIPLLKDLPFVQSLDFNGAIRYTDYSTSGSVTTWKAGGEWHVNDELNFRLTRSLDIRAPTLTELFAPLLVAPNGNTDYHVSSNGLPPYGFASIIVQDTISNPNLVPEQANTWTVGGVYRPAWLDNFSLSIDYYKMKIGNAITSIQGSNQQIQGICEASGGTSPYCSLIVRPGPFSDHSVLTNLVTAFIGQPRNVAGVRTEGVDIEANYQTDLGPGHFAVRALASYQPELKTQNFPGATTTNAANAPGLPAFRSTWFFKYTWEDVSLDVLQKFHGKVDWNADRTQVYAMPSLPEAWYTNATVTYHWEPVDLFLAVENVFNKQPTPYAGGGAQQGIPGLFGGWEPGDDSIGRYYTIGVRAQL
jgi:outer membrane receptor protein involved in Fe transport